MQETFVSLHGRTLSEQQLQELGDVFAESLFLISPLARATFNKGRRPVRRQGRTNWFSHYWSTEQACSRSHHLFLTRVLQHKNHLLHGTFNGISASSGHLTEWKSVVDYYYRKMNKTTAHIQPATLPNGTERPLSWWLEDPLRPEKVTIESLQTDKTTG